MSIDLVLCGATGRLGKEILIEVEKQSNINLIGCVASKNNKNFGKKIATFIESNCELELKDSFEEISKPDVVIDVSSPEAFEDIVKFSEIYSNKPNFDIVLETYKEIKYSKVRDYIIDLLTTKYSKSLSNDFYITV